ncbi:response regulator transcription factor [Thaumasiovibrio subtropicus]|uniref:response regulator transcription factor n=1 Tax=Thaumasiovibrio subtropicus TaxID=1891207 RepID=UPI000B35955F|nr:response regulator transcription factor [Thaumasiovibrio subtropicus]
MLSTENIFDKKRVLLATPDAFDANYPGYSLAFFLSTLNNGDFVVTHKQFSQLCDVESFVDEYDVIVIGDEEFTDLSNVLLERIRIYSTLPVLVLVYEYSLAQCNQCFERGGDDYVAGPKHLQELPSRIVATWRRSQRVSVALSRHEMLLEDLYLNRRKSIVKVSGTTVAMTPIQFSLLWVLATHRTQVLDKAFLYKSVLQKALTPHDRTLDMHLSRVRKKLTEAGLEAERIRTVHGVGYCLTY